MWEKLSPLGAQSPSLFTFTFSALPHPLSVTASLHSVSLLSLCVLLLSSFLFHPSLSLSFLSRLPVRWDVVTSLCDRITRTLVGWSIFCRTLAAWGQESLVNVECPSCTDTEYCPRTRGAVPSKINPIPRDAGLNLSGPSWFWCIACYICTKILTLSLLF